MAASSLLPKIPAFLQQPASMFCLSLWFSLENGAADG
jgi:hypothetical protein